MDILETGELISKLRKEKGFTQYSLAKELNVTDKAISKWERGICLPDVSLFPRLSILLDCDIEFLLTHKQELHYSSWNGFLNVDERVEKRINDKPIIDYLLSYFLLAGITHIFIKTNSSVEEFIRKLNYERIGVVIDFSSILTDKPVMVCNEPIFLFGCNLTRMFHSCMISDKPSTLVADNSMIPIFFSPSGNVNINEFANELVIHRFTRGMIHFPLTSEQNLQDANSFVRIYESNHQMKIADLNEISKKRNLIK